ncbi:MAG: hypothetical protein H8E90_02725 [Anaerolineales bacterium]|nr:hypothetical protein [Anaerolineales bacterium]
MFQDHRQEDFEQCYFSRTAYKDLLALQGDRISPVDQIAASISPLQ